VNKKIVFACLVLPSLCFGAGVTIELDTAVTVGSFKYVEDSCLDQDSQEECEFDFSAVEIDPESISPRAPVYESIREEPNAIAIAISNKPEDEGIISRKSANVSFSYGSEVKVMQQYGGKFAVYSNDGIIHFYEFDFQTPGPSTTYDYVPAVTAESFSLQEYRFSEYNRIPEEQDLPLSDRTPVSRFMPVVVSESQDTRLIWSEHPDVSERFEGAFTNYDYYDLPEGLQLHMWPINLNSLIYQREEYSWGTVYSYENDDTKGLWLTGYFADGDAPVSQQVSNIAIEHSIVSNSHLGLTQFFSYGESNTLHARPLEWSQLPTYQFSTIQNVKSLNVIYNGSGTVLEVVDVADITKFYWWGYADPVEVMLPESDNVNTNLSIEYCDGTQGKIYCIVQLDTGEVTDASLSVYEYKLYELVDGTLVFDRDITSPALRNGFISIQGIYSYGYNRLIFVNTLDLRHRVFNVMPEKTHYVGVSGSSGVNWNVGLLEDREYSGVVYWVFSTSGQVYAYKYTLDLNEPEPEPEPDVDVGGEAGSGDSSDDDFDERDLEEEEEERIIPRAELSGSLGWLIMLVLYAAYLPRRFAK